LSKFRLLILFIISPLDIPVTRLSYSTIAKPAQFCLFQNLIIHIFI
jgi:hypothetical protein